MAGGLGDVAGWRADLAAALQAGDGDLARAICRAAMAGPEAWDAEFALLTIEVNAGVLAASEAPLLALAARRPDSPDLWTRICHVRSMLGRFDEAVVAGRRSLALAPDRVDALHTMGTLLHNRRDFRGALECFLRGTSLHPGHAGCHLGLAEALLMTGWFLPGWREYEWRYSLPDTRGRLPRTRRPQWSGAPLRSTLVVIADQGYGDCFQFARYLPLVAQRVGRLVVLCSPLVAGVLGRVPGVAACVNSLEKLPPHEFQITLSGLPGLFATGLQSIPGPVPYLSADPARVAHWKGALAALAGDARGPRVGFVWEGRPTPPPPSRRRSIPLGQMEAVIRTPGIVPVCLQVGLDPGVVGGTGMIDLGPALTNFAETAAVLANLDLVVTVDTAMAHLAGALGRPVWIALPWSADWRWLDKRADSPWYPTARLFRCLEPGDFAQPLGEIAAALRRLAAGDGPGMIGEGP